MKTPYTLAYSSCPNDTFIFKGIAKHLIDLQGLSFDIHMEDVETLNRQAERQIHDITKLSFAALGNLLDRYALLRTGAALGRGCGPLVISLPGRNLDTAGPDPVVAVRACAPLPTICSDSSWRTGFPASGPGSFP